MNSAPGSTGVLFGLAFVIFMQAAGCGGGDAEGGCEGLCNRLCRMATDCIKTAGQEECYFKIASADGGTQLQGRNVAGRGCEYGMVRDVCGDTTKPPALFSACEAALGSATCAVDEARDVLVLPDACRGLLDCKSGPCLD